MLEVSVVMDGYEKILSIIRKEVKRSQITHQIRCAVMTSEKTCVVGKLELDEDDLIKADIELKEGDDVLIVQVSEDTWAILCKVVRL